MKITPRNRIIVVLITVVALFILFGLHWIPFAVFTLGLVFIGWPDRYKNIERFYYKPDKLSNIELRYFRLYYYCSGQKRYTLATDNRMSALHLLTYANNKYRDYQDQQWSLFFYEKNTLIEDNVEWINKNADENKLRLVLYQLDRLTVFYDHHNERVIPTARDHSNQKGESILIENDGTIYPVPRRQNKESFYSITDRIFSKKNHSFV